MQANYVEYGTAGGGSSQRSGGNYKQRKSTTPHPLPRTDIPMAEHAVGEWTSVEYIRS